MGTTPPPPETKREPLPARGSRQEKAPNGTSWRGSRRRASRDPTSGFLLTSPPRTPPQGGTRDSGSRPPLAQETSGSGGGCVPKLFKRLESPPPSSPKASNSPTSRDPEGPGSLSARARSWGAPLRGKPPIPALRSESSSKSRRPRVRAWLGSRRRVPAHVRGCGSEWGCFGVWGAAPRAAAAAAPARDKRPRPAGPEGALSTPLPSLRAPGRGEPGACAQAESGPAGPGVQGGHGDPQASPPIAPASNGPRLRSVGRRPRTPGARLPAPGYGGRRGPIPAPLALRRPALCQPRSPAGRAARPEPRRGG